MKILTKITEICHSLLQNHPEASEAREYFNSRIPKEAQEEYQAGFFPDQTNLQLITDLISEEKLVKSGLFHYRIIDGESFLGAFFEKHNFIFPYKDAYGKIVALVGRSPTETKMKYKNTSFRKRNHLFGLFKAKKAILENNCAYVVEGQFDCIQAQINGLENCVCLGGSSLTFDQLALLKRYTNKVILLLDNDPAGLLGMDKAIKNFGSMAEIKKGKIPEGYKDIDQFISQEGKKAAEYIKNLAAI